MMIWRSNNRNRQKAWPVRSLWSNMGQLQRERDHLLGGTRGPVRTKYPALNAWVGDEGVIVTAEIPGVDPELRVGEVSFPSRFYARSEIIKASSALTVARQIVDKIQEEGIVLIDHKGASKDDLLSTISKAEIDQLAKEFVVQRGYPEALSRLVINRD